MQYTCFVYAPLNCKMAASRVNAPINDGEETMATFTKTGKTESHRYDLWSEFCMLTKMHNEIVSDYGRGCHEQKISGEVLQNLQDKKWLQGRFRKALYMIETCSSSIQHTSAQVYELVHDIHITKGPRSTGVSVEDLPVACKNLISAHTSDSTGSHSSSSIICLCSHRHCCSLCINEASYSVLRGENWWNSFWVMNVCSILSLDY